MVSVDEIRADLPSATACVYLNAGTWGPLPTPAAAAMRARIADVEAGGRIGERGYARFGELIAAARSALATTIGAEPESIALTHSTTGGMNLVLAGLDWERGDEVVISDNEHPGLLEPLYELERRRGIVIRISETLRATDALASLTGAIGPRTRLVAVSHVLWASGRILPIRELAVATHAAGAQLLVDGAQAVGAIPVDPLALGCDYYAGPAQKWLCGPNGVGFLWVAPARIGELGLGSAGWLSRDTKSEGRPLWASARRYDSGSLSTIALAGSAAAIAWRAERVGWETGFERMRERRATLAAALGGLANVTLHEFGGEHAPLIAFSVDGLTAGVVSAALDADGIRGRSLPDPAWMRVATGFWLSDGDCERLCSALRSL